MTQTAKLVMHGPVKMETKIGFKTSDGSVGELTWSFPVGRYPTPKEIERVMADALKELRRSIKDPEAQWLNREEFEQQAMMDATNTNIKFAATQMVRNSGFYKMKETSD